jgi:hypothetical protein
MAAVKPAQIPTTLNADQAWSEYETLALHAAAKPVLMANVHFAREFARAWERWRDLFLQMDKAA